MTTDFTDAEKLMYRIIAAICETDAPIIFEALHSQPEYISI